MKALVTGVTGQDGSWMVDLLRVKGYEVHGVVRRSVSGNGRIEGLEERGVVVHEADLVDGGSIEDVVREVGPDEVYNFAAQSHVGTSFSQPEYTLQVTGLGAVRVFEACARHAPGARVFQASSSEMFGNVEHPEGGLSEESGFRPVSPYGCAKLYAHHMAGYYRKAGGLFVACGISFNHESEKRHPSFVTRKVTSALARIRLGLQEELVLGNLSAVRDWGYAPEYVLGAWLLLQEDEPLDVVFATGEGYSVEEFVEEAVRVSGVDPERVRSSQRLLRPTEVHRLVGDASKAREVLGWVPEVGFKELVARMFSHDLRLAHRGDGVERVVA